MRRRRARRRRGRARGRAACRADRADRPRCPRPRGRPTAPRTSSRWPPRSARQARPRPRRMPAARHPRPRRPRCRRSLRQRDDSDKPGDDALLRGLGQDELEHGDEQGDEGYEREEDVVRDRRRPSTAGRPCVGRRRASQSSDEAPRERWSTGASHVRAAAVTRKRRLRVRWPLPRRGPTAAACDGRRTTRNRSRPR